MEPAGFVRVVHYKGLQEVFEGDVYPTAVVKKVLLRRKLARTADRDTEWSLCA